MSIRVTGTRVGADGNSNVFNDRDLKDAVDLLDTILQNSAPEDLVDDIVTELEGEYGSSNVSRSPTSQSFRWEWNSTANKWEKKKDDSTTIDVDDGNPGDVRIVVVITDDVP